MKEYKNSNELLDYIISKGVSVNNKEDALYKIKTYSYYSIINTYKDVFKNTNNDISSKIKEIEKIMNEPTSIKEFDKETFDSIVERIILGDTDENGNSNPNVVRFILKTGKEYKCENNRIDTSVSFGSYKRFSKVI